MTTRLSVSEFQKHIAEFVMGRHDADIENPRIQVYRNNVISSLVKALEAQYPAVRSLVGEQFFGALARDYLAAEFPTDPVLTFFGGTFAELILNHDKCRTLTWLADVARLEYCQQLVLHGADDPALKLEEIGTIPQDRLGDLVLICRDSCRLLSSDWPVEAIRQEAISENPGQVDMNGNERFHYLIQRTNLAVATRELPENRWVFLTMLQRGLSLSDAWEQLQKQYALSDDALPSLLSQILADGIFTSYTLPTEAVQ